MELMIAGLVLWSVVHLLPSAARPLRDNLVGRLGENPYKGLFSLALVLAVVLIVFGWRGTPPQSLYVPPPGMRHVTMGLVLLAFILMAASQQPSRIRRVVRHPQLTGVALWAVAHLLCNGEQRSVLLFGSLLAWAVVEIVLISRREGPWQKPEPAGWGRELALVAGGAAVYLVLVFAHPWISGMPLL